MALTKKLFSLLILLALFACDTGTETSQKHKLTQINVSLAGAESTTTENFESGSKGSYATGTVTLSTGSWTLSDALLGNLSNDRKNGATSVRMRNTGYAQMNFDLSGGASTVTVKHAKYGSDGNSTWELVYSTNGGSSWIKTGATITTSSTTLSVASFTVNKTGAIRFRINKLSGGSARINLDDFTVTSSGGDTGGGTPGGAITSETESNNTLATANAVGGNSTSITGTMSSTTDKDIFKFSATSGQKITLGLTVPSGKDYDLYLLNGSGSTIARSENWYSASESIEYTMTADGTYYVYVMSYSGSSTTATYTLSFDLTGGSTTPPPTPSNVHLTFGNPSSATTATSNKSNYLMIKNGYALSFNGNNGNPNWVSWHLDNTWTGSASRQNDFRQDPSLPSGWLQPTGPGFGGGFDRGHMTPSADRTSTVSINSETFLMTNMLPQASNNNQGPWNKMESYLRGLFPNELYVISGGHGSQGNTERGGNVNIPTHTWKVVLVLSSGSDDVNRVTTSTRTIAIWMPNNSTDVSRSDSWQQYRVSVDYVESQTGYNFFSEIPDAIENVIEARTDNQ